MALVVPNFRYTWTNKNGVIVQVIVLGGAVTSIQVPDKNGKLDDVVAGYDTVAGESGASLTRVVYYYVYPNNHSQKAVRGGCYYTYNNGRHTSAVPMW